MILRAQRVLKTAALIGIFAAGSGCANPTPPPTTTAFAPTDTPPPSATPAPSATCTAVPPQPVGPILEPASPEKGFDWPYLLYVPSARNGTHILVVPNNTGKRANDFAVHETSARDTVSSRRSWAEALGVPLLVPIFPRFDDDSDGTIASQYLGRGTLEATWQKRYPDLAREDLQLIAMINDAIARLEEMHLEVDAKVLLEGYSGSGMFVSRFTILHPDRVRASAFGGHGWAIAPSDRLQNLSLPYPYGTGDIESLIGSPFDIEDFRRVAIYAYMGGEDDNGWALPWYTGQGRDRSSYYTYFSAIVGSSARQMSDRANQVYESSGCQATFVVHEGDDHMAAYKHDHEVLQFLMEYR